MKIEVKGLKKHFRGTDTFYVLNGIDACFDQSKTYAITGVSGAGKSTFLHILAGLDAPSEGSIYFDGKDLATLSHSERLVFLNKSIGLVFQLPYLIAELSVIENTMVPGLISGLSVDECRFKALRLLELVGISEKVESCPLALSGGQQQRVAVARAIFNEPAFLLADEPTGNLDINTGKTLIDLLQQCKKEWGMGIIISSHDNYVAQKMDYVFHIDEGALNQERFL